MEKKKRTVAIGKITTILILDWNYKVVNNLLQTLCCGKSLPRQRFRFASSANHCS